MQRDRVFKNEFLGDVTMPWYTINGVLKPYLPALPYTKTRLYVAMQDVVTEGWREKQRAGEIVNNPLKKIIYNLKQSPTIQHAGGQCADYDEYEQWNLFPPAYEFDPNSPFSLVDTICDAYQDESEIAQVKAWANIDVSEIQGLASLGELPESVKMLIDLFKEAIRLTVAAKRGDWRALIKPSKKVGFHLDRASNIWLGYRYGIRPLVSEIQSVMEAVHAELSKGMRFTARGKYTSDTKDEVYTDDWPTQVYMIDKWRTRTTISRSFRAGVLVGIDHDVNSLMAIWGLDSPIEAAWELVPFSFIIDWFCNIGDLLGAAVLNPSLTPLTSWVTETVQYSQSSICTGFDKASSTNCAQQNPTPHHHQLGFTSLNITVKRRVPVAKRFDLPSLNLRLDAAKITDLILIARKLL